MSRPLAPIATPADPAGFVPSNGTLTCDGVPIADIARTVGTPFYVYSAATIAERYLAFDRAFAAYPHALHYALKANSTLAIARLLRSLGSNADANSGGEIEVALRAGFIPTQIVFTGVGKTVEELERAASLGLKVINAESPGELSRIDAIARAQGARVRVALRVNPDVDAQSHPHISTGLKTNKFGVALSEARDICVTAARQPGLELVGIHVHIGSQITNLAPLARAAASVMTLVRELRDAGVTLEHVDLGGGLGIAYDGASVPDPHAYVSTLLAAVADSGLSVIVEPGRAVVGPAGALIARIVDMKAHPGGKRFVVLDAGMTELLRPALYGAYHRVEPVTPRPAPPLLCDIVGPICESSDTVGLDRTLPEPAVGDLVAVLDAGAYGSVMANNYNRRPLPPEVLVQDGAWRVIRRRQTIDEMVSLED